MKVVEELLRNDDASPRAFKTSPNRAAIAHGHVVTKATTYSEDPGGASLQR
jgi:hypothetical protein